MTTTRIGRRRRHKRHKRRSLTRKFVRAFANNYGAWWASLLGGDVKVASGTGIMVWLEST